jgi:hypothetical protein
MINKVKNQLKRLVCRPLQCWVRSSQVDNRTFPEIAGPHYRLDGTILHMQMDEAEDLLIELFESGPNIPDPVFEHFYALRNDIVFGDWFFTTWADGKTPVFLKPIQIGDSYETFMTALRTRNFEAFTHGKTSCV